MNHNESRYSRSVRKSNRHGEDKPPASDLAGGFFYSHPQYHAFPVIFSRGIQCNSLTYPLGYVKSDQVRKLIIRKLNAKFCKPAAYLTLSQKRRLAAWLKQHPPT